MEQFEKFIKINKINDDQRIVSGYASTPDLDSDGEIVSLEAMMKALPNYMQFPTIRRMHQLDPVGTTLSANIQDDGLFISAKIVDDDAWKKIKEGVYKGFSIGGRVVTQVKNVITDLILTEISLVDVPANKQAVITLYKLEKDQDKIETLFSLFVLRKYIEFVKKNSKQV